MAANNFYWPPISTRAQTTTLVWPPKKQNMEGMAVNNQEQTRIKQLKMWKFHANNIHTKLGHPGEDNMSATVNHLHDIIKGGLEVCE